MKRENVIFPLTSLLLFLSITSCFVNLAKANDSQIYELPRIVIRDDFRITSGIVEQTGNVYTLTTNLVDTYVIEIQSSNIIFDGGSHLINTSTSWSIGIVMKTVTNVTIKNLEIIGARYYSIWVYYSSNCTFKNIKTSDALSLSDGCNNNTITECNLESLFVGRGGANNNTITENIIKTEFHASGQHNKFYQNNFLFEKPGRIYPDNFWDNGSEGNYWSGYNGTDSNADGIGDRPYVIDENNQDNYPLMEPVEIQTIPEFPTWIILPILVIAPLFVIVFKKKTFRSIQAHLPAPS